MSAPYRNLAPFFIGANSTHPQGDLCATEIAEWMESRS